MTEPIDDVDKMPEAEIESIEEATTDMDIVEEDSEIEEDDTEVTEV